MNTSRVIDYLLSYYFLIGIPLFLSVSYLFITYKNKIKNEALSLVYYHHILDHLPGSFGVWDAHNNTFWCNQSFKKILDMASAELLTLEMVFRQLEANAFSALSKAVGHLLDYDGPFELIVTFQKRELKISGIKLYFDENDQLRTQKTILLWIEDVSQTYHELQTLKRHVHSLSQHNALLTTFMNELPFAAWKRNHQKRIVYCNVAYAGALNTTPAKVIAENLELSCQPRENLNALTDHVLVHREKTTIRLHAIIDTQRRLLEVTELPYPETNTVIGYALDITEVEEKDAILNKTTKAYHDILNALSIPVAVYDDTKRISFYNKAYMHLFEFQERFLNLRPTLSDILDDLRKRRKMQEYGDFQRHKHERNQLFNNLLAPIEEVSYLPSGQTLRIRISPYPLGGILFIFENLTSQLDLERNLKTYDLVQKAILNHLSEGILVLGIDYKIKCINPALFHLFQIPEHPCQDAQHFIDYVKETFTDQNRFQTFEHDFRRCLQDRPTFLKPHIQPIHSGAIKWIYIPLPDGSHMFSFNLHQN